MKNNKFTNGPWTYMCYGQYPVVVSKGNKYIGTLNSENGDNIPNAHLIAAAPEMYDLLNLLAETIERDYQDQNTEGETVNLYADIHRLLKKTRGE